MNVPARSRRGFALLTVLWLVALLGGVTSGLLMIVRHEQNLSQNRVALTRVRWAQDACLGILQAHYARQQDVRVVDLTDLGRGVWCRAAVTDLTARVNLNLAPRALLRAALDNDSLVDALMDWRDPDSALTGRGAEQGWYAAHRRDGPRNGPFRSVAELTLVRGFEAAPDAWLDAIFTVEGDGRINPTWFLPQC